MRRRPPRDPRAAQMEEALAVEVVRVIERARDLQGPAVLTWQLVGNVLASVMRGVLAEMAKQQPAPEYERVLCLVRVDGGGNVTFRPKVERARPRRSAPGRVVPWRKPGFPPPTS